MTNMSETDVIYKSPRKPFDFDNRGSFNFEGAGADNWIDIQDPSFNLSRTDGVNDLPFTISAWVRPDNLTSSTQYVFRGGNSSYNLLITTFRITLRLSSSVNNYIQRQAFNDVNWWKEQTLGNQWVHIIATYDGSKDPNGITFYLNGVKYEDLTNTLGTYAGVQDVGEFKIGEGSGGSTTFLNAKLNHVSIIDRVITDVDAEELYNDGSPIDVRECTFASDFISHWCLDQRDDPTGVINDIVGSNDGTGQNMLAGNLLTDNYPKN
jgi:hypothetical protein